jgi:hypothetical protein
MDGHEEIDERAAGVAADFADRFIPENNPPLPPSLNLPPA